MSDPAPGAGEEARLWADGPLWQSQRGCASRLVPPEWWPGLDSLPSAPSRDALGWRWGSAGRGLPGREHWTCPGVFAQPASVGAAKGIRASLPQHLGHGVGGSCDPAAPRPHRPSVRRPSVHPCSACGFFSPHWCGLIVYGGVPASRGGLCSQHRGMVSLWLLHLLTTVPVLSRCSGSCPGDWPTLRLDPYRPPSHGVRRRSA